MKHLSLMLFALVVLGFLFVTVIPVAAEETTNGTVLTTDTLEPIDGAIGPANPLYGFKLTLENIDESFTLNQTEKLEKMVNRTELRLAELKAALEANQTDAANRTLEEYLLKYNQTEDTLERLALNDTFNMPAPNGTSPVWTSKNTGLVNALANLNQHQVTFQNLMQAYPNNTGLKQAYNNSLARELKFEEKIQERSRFGETNGTVAAYSGQSNKGNTNQTANVTRAGNSQQSNIKQNNQSRNETASSVMNKSETQAGNSIKVKNNSAGSDNQSVQEQRQQQTVTKTTQGQQNVDQQGSSQGKNNDNSAAQSQKTTGREDSGDTNNGNSAGKGNRN